MATTATTPSELYIAINETIRSQVTPNSITPQTHSDLLDNVVRVLSADTYTIGGTYDSSASTINFIGNSTGNVALCIFAFLFSPLADFVSIILLKVPLNL